MATPRAAPAPAHRTAHKLSSCSSTIESAPICSSHASMFSIHSYLSIRCRLVGFAFPVNADYCAMNSIVRNTVPVRPFAVPVAHPVDVFALNVAPFPPYAFHRSNSSHNSSTDNSTALCVRQRHSINIWLWLNASERMREQQRDREKKTEWNYHICVKLQFIELQCNLLK